ncbi:MFS transporter [Acinetobacter larvae]|uniref:MFS transporter n=1 Tax=Acinetobacter larvae TaxID=1789224 RepID=A0A1B2LY09_9GAMM|nr:MFS transporter [Acinetobacter larvae]AOA57834.1 MFS transporter [Acinetobacter larvae]
MHQTKVLFLSYMLLQMSFMMVLPIIGPVIRTQGLLEWHAGLIVSLSGLFWMLTAKFWGKRSDQLGRKKVYLPLTIGFFVSYLLWAIFITYTLQHHLTVMTILLVMLLLRCVNASFFSGVNPVVVGYIADHYQGEQRAAYLAGMGAVGGLALFVGPFIGGALSNSSLSLPFYFAAALPLLALLLITFKLKESQRIIEPSKIQSVNLKMTDPRIRFAVLMMFLTMNCILTFNMCIGFYTFDHLHLSSQQQSASIAGMTLSAVGLTLIIVQVILSKIKPKRHFLCLSLGVLSMVVGIISVTLTEGLLLFVSSAILMGIGGGMIFPMLSIITANRVEAHEQGAASGLISAAQGLAMMITPLLATVLYHYKIELPYWLAALLLLVVALILPKRIKNEAQHLQRLEQTKLRS